MTTKLVLLAATATLALTPAHAQQAPTTATPASAPATEGSTPAGVEPKDAGTRTAAQATGGDIPDKFVPPAAETDQAGAA